LPRLAPPPVQLNDCEREQLEQLINRHRTPQQIVLRANIISSPVNGNQRSPGLKHQPGDDPVVAESVVGVEPEGRSRG